MQSGCWHAFVPSLVYPRVMNLWSCHTRGKITENFLCDFPSEIRSRSKARIVAVAYLGFRKSGGANFCWPLVLIQRRGKPSFPIFLNVKKNLTKGGPWPNAPPPPKYASDSGRLSHEKENHGGFPRRRRIFFENEFVHSFFRRHWENWPIFYWPIINIEISSVSRSHVIYHVSGVFRISKRGAKFSLATSAHTKGGGQTKFSNFFSMSKKSFWPKGGHGTMSTHLNTPLYHVMLWSCKNPSCSRISLGETENHGWIEIRRYFLSRVRDRPLFPRWFSDGKSSRKSSVIFLLVWQDYYMLQINLDRHFHLLVCLTDYTGISLSKWNRSSIELSVSTNPR